MSAKKPLVSVVLPVFNGEVYIAKAIDSIRDQSFSDWELIILDDGSTDNSYAICLDYADLEPRIRVFQNEQNQGLAKTMNRLVSLVQGTYIAIQEQDDVSSPDRLSQEVKVLKKQKNIGLVSGVAAWVNDEGDVIRYFPGRLHRGQSYPETQFEMVSYLYIEQCKIVNAACMFRREIIDNIPGPFDEMAKMSIDWQFFLHVAHQWQIKGIPSVLVNMNRGKTHTHLTRQKELQFSEARRCIRLIYDQYKQDPNSPINFHLFRQAMATGFRRPVLGKGERCFTLLTSVVIFSRKCSGQRYD